MKRALLTALLASALCATAAAQTPPPGVRDAIGLIDRWLAAQREFERVPGLSAGVVVGQELVWSKGYGERNHARTLPATPDTIYGICSISKLFTAVAVMQLWEAGKLHLDDDVAKHLPGFTLQRAQVAGGPITIENLLTHASGLPREAVQSYWTGDDPFPTREQLMAGLAGQFTYRASAERFQYSNLGMSLLGEVVAAVSGESYADYVQRHILTPLKLADTASRMPNDQWGQRLSQGFAARQRDGSRTPLPSYDTRGLNPAAGYSSTVQDLARFASWQFRLRKASAPEVLRPATLRDMQRIHWSDADGKNTWGLGFGITRDGNQLAVGHTGVCPGQLTALSLMPEPEIAVIAMVNANDRDGAGRYTAPMRQLINKALKLPSGKEALQDYAGEYDRLPRGSGTLVVPWGDGLAMLALPSSNPAGDLTVLRASGTDKFRTLRDDGSLAEEWVFVRDARGVVAGYEVWGQKVKKVAS